LAKLERTGEKTIQNILKGIEASKQIPFQRVLFGLGIRHVGETMAAKLAWHFGSIEAIAAATVDQLTAIHDVGQSVADSLEEYFSVSDNLEQLEMLKQAGLQLEVSAEAMQITDSPLNGKRVLVSGNVPGYTRLQLKELLEKNGASVASGVSAKLDYFFVGEEAGASKLKKAEELGIAKRPYTELIDYISGK
jgi:DNA ligase (NAD+)